MIVGFNHNISHKGTGFHVQTEDSGVKSPQLVTLLYHGGTIIASQKTVYADILQVDNLTQVVEELAKEQHKGMLRRLTSGEFDQRIVDLGIPFGDAPMVETPAEVTPVEPAPEVKKPVSPAPLPEAKPLTETATAQVVTEAELAASKPESELDELILAYLSAGSD